MSESIFKVAAFLAMLGSGLMSGTFFAFSSFVMRAVSRLPAGQGIAAMQSINVAVINPVFLGVFLATAAVSAVALVGALLRWKEPGAGSALAAAGCYIVGTFLVTMLCNVPLNNRLAKLRPGSSESSAEWANYLRRWTLWNHVRTVAALTALATFAMSLRN